MGVLWELSGGGGGGGGWRGGGGVLWEWSGGGGGGGGWRDSTDSSVMPTVCTASGKTSKTGS